MRSAVAGAGATALVGVGVFFAVAASNAEEMAVTSPVTPPGHYSTIQSQDPITYVPEADPAPVVAAPVVEEPVVSEPAPVVEQPAPAPAPVAEPAPEPAAPPVETPPTNLDLGPAPVEPPGTVAPGGGVGSP